jgi:hypothetical protein
MLYVGRDILLRPRDENNRLADSVRHADLVEDVGILLRTVGEDEPRGANAIPNLSMKGTGEKMSSARRMVTPQLFTDLFDMIRIDLFNLCVERHQDEDIHFLFGLARPAENRGKPPFPSRVEKA